MPPLVLLALAPPELPELPPPPPPLCAKAAPIGALARNAISIKLEVVLAIAQFLSRSSSV
ncbi:hypothetical protein BF49_5279 [Bradyrhizobium sp.]|nr:hypothetical protein BF49_5279 [Bradyrhizobium sp.]